MSQDWSPMTLRSKTSGNTKQNVAAAQQRGGPVQTEKKFNAGTNKKSVTDKNLTKVDAETEVFEHKKVPTNVAKEIAKARMAKKMTQQQLAQAINEKATVVNEYEAGKALPNSQILSKMERVLGVKLQGKK